MVCAGIVAYNPRSEELRNCVGSISPQVEWVFVINNGGTSNSEENICAEFPNVIYTKNASNLGVAAALNQIFMLAIAKSADWVLTLDQDTISKPGIIKKYLSAASPECGILTCNILDRNTGRGLDGRSLSNQVETVNQCITSGAFCSVDAYKRTNGFDEWLFIDQVDFDYCYSVREQGFLIRKIPYGGFVHSVGRSKIVLKWPKPIISFDEPPFRQYYMARNLRVVMQKHHVKGWHIKSSLKELKTRAIILLFEKDKISKIRERKRGILDAKKWRKNTDEDFAG